MRHDSDTNWFVCLAIILIGLSFWFMILTNQVNDIEKELIEINYHLQKIELDQNL